MNTDVTVMDIAAKKFTDLTDFEGIDSWPMRIADPQRNPPFLIAKSNGVYTRSCEQARAAIAPISSVESSTSQSSLRPYAEQARRSVSLHRNVRSHSRCKPLG